MRIENLPAFDVLSHNLDIEIFPQERSLKAKDEILIKNQPRAASLDFIINSGLKVKKVKVNKKDVEFSQDGWKVEVKNLPKDLDQFKLEVNYQGRIYNPGWDQIDSKSTFLRSECCYYPMLWGDIYKGKLNLTCPGNFKAVAVGDLLKEQVLPDGKKRYVFNTDFEIDGLTLTAADYKEENAEASGIKVSTLFFPEDNDKSKEYLETAIEVIKKYNDLFGPYPFGTFVIAETLFKGGYGAASFIMLNQDSVKNSPSKDLMAHEISHQWWGNKIPCKISEGLWNEALATYSQAIYREKELTPEQLTYRRMNDIQYFQKHINPQNDFPLKEYHGDVSNWPVANSIGYLKGSFVFSMLRDYLGDELFFKGLKEFSKAFTCKLAGWSDIERTFSQVWGKDLSWFFSQWTERKGIPEFKLKDWSYDKVNDGYLVKVKISQEGEPFKVKMPVVIKTLQGKEIKYFELSEKLEEIKFKIESTPEDIQIDPEVKIFRKLNFEDLFKIYSRVSEDYISTLPVSQANKKDTKSFNEQAMERITWIAKKDKKLACQFLKHKINKVNNAASIKPEERMEEIYYSLWNLGPVDKKVLRGSQPSALDIKWMKEIGVSKIINLRKEDYVYSGKSLKEMEKEACRKHGLDYGEFQLVDNEKKPPTKEKIQEAVDCIKESNGPVFIHCFAGQGRTGMVVAAYRMQVCGWSLKKALAEAEEYGFIPELRQNQVEVLKEFDRSNLLCCSAA